jgi:hypothetical protein
MYTAGVQSKGCAPTNEMPSTDSLVPIEDTPSPQAFPGSNRKTKPAAKVVPISPLQKLLISIAELVLLTGLSERHLRRRDASRDIPGRVTQGSRVLFRTEVIRDWVEAGLPDRNQWAKLLKQTGKADGRKDRLS